MFVLIEDAQCLQAHPEMTTCYNLPVTLFTGFLCQQMNEQLTKQMNEELTK